MGTIAAGVAGEAAFAVTASNIDNTSYKASVANLPAGVTVQNASVYINSSGDGNLTLAADGSQKQATATNLRLTLDNTQSEAFTLEITSRHRTRRRYAGKPL